MKKPLLILFASFVILATAFVASGGYIYYSFKSKAPSDISQEVVYEVAPGKSFNTIAADLESKGLITNANFFSLYARFKGERSKLKVGEYLLKTDMRPDDVLAVITSGKSIARGFTVSEGLSIYEIADLYQKEGFGTAAEFLQWVRNPTLIKNLLGENYSSLEGYLFPETYMLTKFTDTKTLISNMVRRFLYVYQEVIPQSKILGLSRHEIVTLASIVEKETGAPQERPLISSVFHNRLQKGMRLQTDPTVIYGKAETLGKIVINITKNDLLTPTKYNTYTIPALPPGPIANPGREALLAAVTPAQSEYLFFVSRNDGTHIFSVDYKGHEAAVRSFQLDRKARQGKSWRDLKKKEAALPKK